MGELAYAGLATVVIPFIVTFAKKYIGTRWAPVVAFALGVGYGVAAYFVSGQQGTILAAILQGAAIGGTSTGLYDVFKTTVRGE